MLSRQSLEAGRALAIYYIEQISPSPTSTKPSVCNRNGSRLSSQNEFMRERHEDNWVIAQTPKDVSLPRSMRASGKGSPIL